MAAVVYATRERIMRAADVKVPAYQSAEIDDRLASASRAVDRLCHRGDEIRPGFAPWTGTITYDWPVRNNQDAYRFWLGQNSLISLTSATSAGTSIIAATLLRPETGPPYSSIRIDSATSSILSIDAGAGEASLALAGVWCNCAVDERSSSTWLLSGNISSSTDQVTLNAPAGVGNIVRLDSERMILTERSWAASGQTGSLTSSTSAQSLTVADGSAFLAGEELILDAERVYVSAVVGNTLLVQRAWSGSTLAAHTTAAIYWSRTFTVERGALGTTAAAHTTGAQAYIYKPPPLVEQLTIAYTLDRGEQEKSAYARTVGTDDGERQVTGRGIQALEERVWAAYGRKLRHRAV